MKYPFTFSIRQSGLLEEEREMYFKKLKPAIARLQDISKEHSYDKVESSISLPDDTKLIEMVIDAKQSIHTDALKYVVVIGIGGSCLGTQAVYDALLGFYDILENDRYPKIITLDTTDVEYLSRLKRFVAQSIATPDEIAVVIVSKSGTTIETIANAEYCLGILENTHGEAVLQRVTVITDENSPLWIEATKKKMHTLPIPTRVGGRYSVFSPVGLFPLSLVGIDIHALCKGALAARTNALATTFKENIAAQSAAVIMMHYTQSRKIHDLFIFNPSFESLGKWYRQLMGESLGKELDTDGTQVHAGLMPTVSIGSTDLHSVGQLYLGGPNSRITTFMKSPVMHNGVHIPSERHFSELVPSINDTDAVDIMSAIYEGVKIAYTNHKLPYMEIELTSTDAYSIGGFMQFKMIEIMYLAELMHINAFDQPNVESYKVETKRILMEE